MVLYDARNRLRFSQVVGGGGGDPVTTLEFGHFPANSPEGRIENSPAVPKGRLNPFMPDSAQQVQSVTAWSITAVIAWNR